MNVIRASLAICIWFAFPTIHMAADLHHSATEAESNEVLYVDSAISEKDLIEAYNVGDWQSDKSCNIPGRILPIEFRSGSTTIGKKSRQSVSLRTTLDPILRDLGNNGKIILIGYSDSSGTINKNKIIAENRAKKTRDLLIRDYGVLPELISTIGYGHLCPVADNNDPTGRARNRRVVLRRLK